MGPVSATTAIDAPRERVFALLEDLSVRPAFTDHFIDELRLERLDAVGLGAAARFRIPARGIWVETVIDEAAPPHRLAERGAGGRLDRLPVHTLWELVEAPGPSGCEVTVTFFIEVKHPLDRLAQAAKAGGREGWYRRQWARALGRLKDLVESGASPERVAVAGGDRLGA
jgi:uncharacterized protein YndB with AHSA1/START domain